MAPRGKTMLGSSRTVEGAKLVGYEFMMIREQGDKYAIEVRPSGKPPSSSPRPPHRLERRLREPEARLSAEDRLSPRRRERAVGVDRRQPHGVSRRFEFPYRQVVCAGSADRPRIGARVGVGRP
jgi:hypothetical protein